MPLTIQRLHSWNVTPREAVELQKRLRPQLRIEKPPAAARIVAGADISYDKNSRTCYATVVVIDIETMEILEERASTRNCAFPYVPGLLTFREGPALIDAFEALDATPQAVIFDGQGIAHPRRMGIAAHMGLFLDIPTVGCAKTRLYGSHTEPPDRVGGRVPLVKDGEVLGAVLRTRKHVRPVYVSPGHRMDVEGAVALILASGKGFRLPEPTRQAHLLSNRVRRESLFIAEKSGA